MAIPFVTKAAILLAVFILCLIWVEIDKARTNRGRK